MKSLIKTLLALTPYRIVRNRNPNRFQAIDTSLKGLAATGYRPRVIIDGGAHGGDFAIAAAGIFPDAKIHMIEPQPACQPMLKKVADERGFRLYPYALASDEQSGSELDLTIEDQPTTGAYVSFGEANARTAKVKAMSLDALFAESITSEDKVLLKLDIQGFELFALRGATRLLKSTEAVLLEVSFFSGGPVPTISSLVAFFDERGYELYDIASLSGRPRDNRLRQGDFIFMKRESEFGADRRWG